MLYSFIFETLGKYSVYWRSPPRKQLTSLFLKEWGRKLSNISGVFFAMALVIQQEQFKKNIQISNSYAEKVTFYLFTMLFYSRIPE
jgi:hypothetical protein